MPFLSIIIPTYNRLNQLIQVLDGLNRQTYPFEQFEVVVVSDGSQDGTEQYFDNLQTPLNIRFISQLNQGAAAARNLGLTLACGEVVLFIDDDVVPTPTLVEEHVRWHKENGDQVVIIGPMLSPPDYKMSPWVRWEQEHLAKQYQAMVVGEWAPTARQFYTGNTSIRRCHLTEIGGFDPSFRRAEDVELAYRLADRGIKFLFNPRAVGYHYAERSYASWAAIPYAYGRNDVVFSCQKGQTWLLPTIFEEFYIRHGLTRLVIHLCLDRQPLRQALLKFFKVLIRFGERINQYYLTDLVCSATFNLNYYQGVADGLGGRSKFFDGLKDCSNRLAPAV